MSLHRFKYLFQQFVNKTATAEETEEFLSMMNRDNYDEEVQVLLDDFWKETASFDSLEEERAERIFNQIMSSTHPEKGIKLRVLKSWWIRAVAAVLILSGVSHMFYKRAVPESATAIVHIKPVEQEQPKPGMYGRRFINLPDGSSVILNENSKLDFDGFNKDGKREVILHGEAYFDIVHDKANPFVVHTGRLQTTVLGTAFNIKASSRNETVVVTVTRGKVKVGDSKHTFNVIVPDEQVIFNTEQTTYIKKTVKAQVFTAWTAGDIYFDDVSMKDVANQLQARFNVSIVFSNELVKNCRFSATFLKTQSLEQILNIIGEFNHIKYQFQNRNTVVLAGIGCEDPPVQTTKNETIN